MSEQPSTGDFLTFQFVWQLAEMTDILHSLTEMGATREERRRLYRQVGRQSTRTKEEVIAALSSGGEMCDEVDARCIFLGLPKKMRSSAKWDIESKVRELGSNFRKCVAAQTQFVRWFSGKRYGIALDHDITSVLSEIDRSTPIGRRDYAVIMTDLHMGLRRSEALSIRAELVSGEWLFGVATREKPALGVPAVLGVGG